MSQSPPAEKPPRRSGHSLAKNSIYELGRPISAFKLIRRFLNNSEALRLKVSSSVFLSLYCSAFADVGIFEIRVGFVKISTPEYIEKTGRPCLS